LGVLGCGPLVILRLKPTAKDSQALSVETLYVNNSSTDDLEF